MIRIRPQIKSIQHNTSRLLQKSHERYILHKSEASEYSMKQPSYGMAKFYQILENFTEGEYKNIVIRILNILDSNTWLMGSLLRVVEKNNFKGDFELTRICIFEPSPIRDFE